MESKIKKEGALTIDRQVIKITLEEIDECTAHIKMRIRGDKEYYFLDFCLHEGCNMTFFDGQPTENLCGGYAVTREFIESKQDFLSEE